MGDNLVAGAVFGPIGGYMFQNGWIGLIIAVVATVGAACVET